MSTATKWIITVIVIAVAGWFLWSSGWLSSPTPAPAANTSQNNAAATAANTPPAPTNGMSASNDASPAAVAQDAAAIDAQMQGLSSDSASVDASFNDKPVTQSY